jgi:hypothetical protein
MMITSKQSEVLVYDGIAQTITNTQNTIVLFDRLKKG